MSNHYPWKVSYFPSTATENDLYSCNRNSSRKSGGANTLKIHKELHTQNTSSSSLLLGRVQDSLRCCMPQSQKYCRQKAFLLLVERLNPVSSDNLTNISVHVVLIDTSVLYFCATTKGSSITITLRCFAGFYPASSN